MSFKLSVDKLKFADQILNNLDRRYRERDGSSVVSSSGENERITEKLDETDVLRTFIEQLRRVIECFPNFNRHSSSMVRGNIEYFMYDIKEIHTILEEALKPVFRLDRIEKRKQKYSKKRKAMEA